MAAMSEKSMRARFAELRKERDAIEAKTQPLKDERAAIRAEAEKKERALAGKIKAAEKGLPEIDREMAMISRALKGRTGKAE